MFGKNKVTKPDYASADLNVVAVFDTFQGEGPYTGHRATFIRLAGCNLRCWFCDTDFESGAKRMNVNELLQAVFNNPAQLVVITGGEPMLQNITQLVKRLAEAGFRVQLETAGTVCPPGLLDLAKYIDVVCSPKTPKVDARMMHLVTAWKYLVDADGEFAGQCRRREDGPVAEVAAPTNSAPVYFQPVDYQCQQTNQRAIQHAVRHAMQTIGGRVSIQTHKIMEVE